MLARIGIAVHSSGVVWSVVRGISVKAQRLNANLPDVDPEVAGIIEKERSRQKKNLVLIASENFTSQAVLDAIGSIMTNKYSEGYPNARYYGGNEYIDQMENLCRQRYTALMEPHERLMALDLPHGGHLSHGYQTDTKKVSMVSKFWTSMPYRLDENTGVIDYEQLELLATRFRPKILITGYSAYPRYPDFKRFREIADKSGSILMCDMAHISGLVAAGVHPSPFEDCDVVTTTTHKTLRGPRGAMIFYRVGQKGVDKKGNVVKYDFAEKINSTVFPGLQGGPHNHIIAGLSVALKQAASVEFREYQQQVVANAAALAGEMQKLGFKLVSDGTDNHLMLVDLKNKGVNGSKVEKIQRNVGSSKQAAFNKFIEENELPEIAELKKEVETFASSFEQVGKAHP
ncbi:conserved hypothetical protein [Perkinsus marinus ATCC 50983]|uniref:Serine hydroxymethyltransferase n=1 Tax=Perkinsus marinus (strain ATCC 50983 / TXsc) TaxID=423536 RepID=C5KDR7_PERM5|nr:conserved hypothetical protein [Perkinsus marinus ATCC 50983]EER17370.1 conserved hypothetical protein [Perkinsus marinus ATCC 50983]|eukprot:XP_002785574.1 conserved hypothetical protein [Perkinsus marinus ATCC 50983]